MPGNPDHVFEIGITDDGVIVNPANSTDEAVINQIKKPQD